mmetsp:Transcript_32848/g.68482  ORF Transcript_32848/g.68482 Transcript_32848/m.68482 type:complete len:86 (+) Transcript_32848:89-346(+)|eukprot:CAMPEP_0172439590 /NCGR_PEP_ID=MMETSP1065-20121228/524_1 /TAXON_ID=265537 /ORGANISM="Amphiprora paludosa, Strain CCMP125" /LENGTH=85 /DNA_ID=CAMNT_0013188291 /DNA_START=92 /DNA_END=349 /DNA_ORIENTATION=+
MGFGSAMVGGTIGFMLQCSANVAVKIPVSRQPWMHVTLFGVGCYLGDYYVKYEAKLLAELNEIRAERGMPPLVPAKTWLGLDIPK